MPHIIVEHSFKIAEPELKNLLLGLNQNVAKNEGNFDISQCKARAVFCQHFVVAGGDKQDFMHISIAILEGRNLQVRQNLAENIIKMVANFLKENNFSSNQIALSINISQMEKGIYQKTVISKT